MLENAKNSSWQDNLRNAADAQQRFMLPGRDIDNGQDKPAYIKRIVDRSEEILQEDKARKEKEEEDRKDPFRSSFGSEIDLIYYGLTALYFLCKQKEE
jgi:hypothetical protein